MDELSNDLPGAASDSSPATLPGTVHRNVEAILAMHSEDQRAMTRHQKTVEKLLAVLSVPAFLYGIAFLIVLWIGINLGLSFSGREPLDRPPFGWLEMAVSVVSLMLTSLIVIAQARQGRQEERNAHLDLQVNLLVDQKVTKIIQLVEELRRDSPSLRDRRDEHAEELKVELDPVHLASVIADKLESASGESMSP